MIQNASYYVKSYKVDSSNESDLKLHYFVTFYDINGNIVAKVDYGTDPNEFYAINLDEELDPACINKSRPTNILVYKHFKTGHINVSFKIGKSEIFTGYRYDEPHNLYSVLSEYKDRIDYDWCLLNTNKIQFEVAQNVNECIIL